MGDKITEHEMITIARYYSSHEKIEHRSREYVRYANLLNQKNFIEDISQDLLLLLIVDSR